MSDNMTNEKAKMCLEDMKIKVPIPKAAKQARENNEALDVAIKALEAEPHWIPVTERLPKPRESVIISVNGKYGDWIGEGCYWETTENHVIWKGYRWNATYWDDEIIAWMPLPEPYKGVTT